MQDLVDELAKRLTIPCLSIAVATDDHPVREFFGSDRGLAIASPIYPVYSITKTFIAATLLKLAEAGRIDLDSSVRALISDAPEGERYTVRHLLNNTSGLPDYYGSPEYREAVAARPDRAWTRAEYIRNTYRGKLLFNPGEGWMYSNLGYMFLKNIIEKISERSLSEAFGEQIFSPLGLSDTRVLVQPSDLRDLVPATSVFISPDKTPKEVRGNYDPAWVAHGVIASSAKNIAQFFRALFRQNFLSAKSLQQMTSLVRVPGNHPPAVSPSYGLGLMGDPDGKFGLSYGHGGGGPGYALFASFWPNIRRGLFVTALTNSEFCNMPLLMEELAGSIEAQ